MIVESKFPAYIDFPAGKTSIDTRHSAFHDLDGEYHPEPELDRIREIYWNQQAGKPIYDVNGVRVGVIGEP